MHTPHDSSHGRPVRPGVPPASNPTQEVVDVPGSSTRVGGDTVVPSTDTRFGRGEQADVSGGVNDIHGEAEVHTETATDDRPVNVIPPA